jgi:hypothetical protein
MNPTAATSKPQSFIGWFRRPGGPWMKFVEGASHASAFHGLLDGTRRMNSDLVVLPAGERPGGVFVRRGIAPADAACCTSAKE